MQKFKIFLASALCALLIASCGMNNTGTKTPSNNNSSNLGNDVKNMGDAVSDTAGDAVNNVTNAVDDLTGTNNNNNTANK